MGLRKRRFGSVLLLSACLAGIAAGSAPTGAAVIGEPDRRTTAAWAEANGLTIREVEIAYAATGVIACTWEDPVQGRRASIASAQVTVQPDLITLAAHTFLDPITCAVKAPASACTFSVEIQGVRYDAGLTEITALGYDCAPPVSPMSGTRLINDWAVARLDRELPVAPYQVVDDLAGEIRRGTPIVSVIHSQDYLVLGPNGGTIHPKTIGNCTVRDIDRRIGVLVYFASDCDGAQRSSGGSVLSAVVGTPTLVGIWAASSEDRFDLDAAVQRILAVGTYRDDLANAAAYNVNGWSSRHVPVAGAFLAAIRAAATAATQ